MATFAYAILCRKGTPNIPVGWDSGVSFVSFDFIIVTKKGNVILLETKGDDRDNSDSAAKNRLGRKMYKKLFVYVGDQHPHTAQQPKELKF